MFAIVAVFIAGLMVGRTPEYLGKKIEAYEMKMASLVHPDPAAASCCSARRSPCGRRRRGTRSATPGAHGFSEILYAFSLGRQQQRQRVRRPLGQQPFYNYALGIACGRALLADHPGARASPAASPREARAAVTAGTCRRTRRCSSCCWSAWSLLVGALTFVPALALGPIVEHLQMVCREDR